MLRFFTELAGPIFAKEMVEVSRRKRYYVNRVLYGTALLIAVMVVWSESGVRFLQASDSQLQRMARFAQEIFFAVAMVQYGAIYLLVPLFVAGLIAGEREIRSLDLLFTTALYDREIVLGKLASRLAIMTLLVLCGVPVMSLILLFGGVDPAAVIRTEAATLLGMLYAGTMTIYFSAISQSPTTALVRSFCWMAVWMVGVPILTVATAELLRIGPSTAGVIVVYSLVLINPLALFVAGLIPDLYQELARYFGGWFFPLAFIPTCLWCVFLLWRSAARLRLPPTVLGRLAAHWHPLAVLAGAWRRGNESIDQRRRQRAERIWPGLPVGNPLWLRARWTRVYDRERHIGRVQWLGWLVAGGFLVLIGVVDIYSSGGNVTLAQTWLAVLALPVAVLIWVLIRRFTSSATALKIVLGTVLAVLTGRLLLLHPRVFREDELATTVLLLAWSSAWLLTVVLGATSLVGDRRRGFLELVLVSPLNPREIIGGTLLAVGQHLVPVYSLACALTIFFTLTGTVSIVGACQVFVTGTLFGLLLLQLGVTCSLAAETPPSALIPTFVFGVVMCFGVPVFAVILRDSIIPLLFAVCTLGLAACWSWERRHSSSAAVAGLFLCVHLALVLVAVVPNLVYLSDSGSSIDFPERLAVATNPLIMTHYHIYRREFGWFGYGPLLVPSYWLALLVNWVLAWKWTNAHFDRLAGRAFLRSVPLRYQRVPDPAAWSIRPQRLAAAEVAPAGARLISETSSVDPR